MPGESQAAFEERVGKAKFVVGDRTNPDVSWGGEVARKEGLGARSAKPTTCTHPQDLAALAKAHDFDVIYDMNGRELSDTKPLADAYKGRVRVCDWM